MRKDQDCRDCKNYKRFLADQYGFKKIGCNIDARYKIIREREETHIEQMVTHDQSNYFNILHVDGYWNGWEGKCKKFIDKQGGD